MPLMSYKGTIQNGQIKLPPDAVLPEGANVLVDVELQEEVPVADFAHELLKLARPRDWPTDMSLNHDHYLHGLPKR
jgi:hypothetical protein